MLSSLNNHIHTYIHTYLRCGVSIIYCKAELELDDIMSLSAMAAIENLYVYSHDVIIYDEKIK